MTDAGTVFGWAQDYFEFGDYANARKWYARRVELGDTGDEEFFLAKYRLAVSMHRLGEVWPQVQDAYLQAWALRPERAEPLHAIASRHRGDGQYHLGYLFARRAVAIALPSQDRLAVDPDVYIWRAKDELAVCAAWVGKKVEAFNLCRTLIALPELPETARERIAKNRDLEVPVMVDSAVGYPEVLAGGAALGEQGADVTLSVISGSDRAAVERTLNSFLNCCRDLSLVQRFIVLDTGLSAGDRQTLHNRYPFIEVVDADLTLPPSGQLQGLRAQVTGRFWLHLGRGWQFFAPEDLITRLKAVLMAEPQVFQVGVNVGDRTELVGKCAPEKAVLRAPGTGRYVRTSEIALGPAMFETARLDQASAVPAADAEVARQLGRAGWGTASLDEVLCIANA